MEENNPFAAKNESKLTRRRVFKIASAAGFSSVTASFLTVDDVKAMSSDEISISLDTEGEYKTNVPADWYEWLLRARKVNKEIKGRWEDRNGVIGVGVSPGKRDGDNPHVIVTIDKQSDVKEEVRGEVSEEENGVRIDIKEGDRRKRRPTSCNSDFYHLDPLPGGLRVRVEDADNPDNYRHGTFTSRLINGGGQTVPFGWATAAYVLPTCDTSQLFKVYHDDDGQETLIGWISLTDEERDFAAISRIPDDDSRHPIDNPPAQRVDPISENADPSSPYAPSSRHEINGTASQDGLDTLVNRGYNFILSCISNCRNTEEINSTDASVWTYPGQFCTGILEDQVRWGSADDTDDGDSGAPVYSEEVAEADGDRFFSHMNVGDAPEPFRDYCFGPAGYAIRNEHNTWWDDL